MEIGILLFIPDTDQTFFSTYSGSETSYMEVVEFLFILPTAVNISTFCVPNPHPVTIAESTHYIILKKTLNQLHIYNFLNYLTII